jgi:cytochrome c553
MRAAIYLPAALFALAFVTTTYCFAEENQAKDKVENAAKLDFFEQKIRPVLVTHCYKCHSAGSEELQANLQLDTRAGLLAGGDSGAAVVPGKPTEGWLMDALRHETFEMPPAGKLQDNVIADFAKWIADGAVDPREGEAIAKQEIDMEAGRKHWAFQPVEKFSPPEVKVDWAKTNVDKFIAAGLTKSKLNAVPKAEPAVLLRRVYFVLTGLPPSPEEIESFVADPSPEAYEKVVDDLIASRQFAEKWSRHWLDVARFAESSGGGRTRIFPDAWRYRDYVIDSFHADKPLNLFFQEQIAGDLMPSNSTEQKRERLTATTYLTLGAINYELQDKELLRMEVVDEQINVITKGMLAMTVTCARCHDHKFDPIPTKDYYALAGIFRSTQTLTPGNVAGSVMRELPAEPGQADAVAAFKKRETAQQDAVAKLTGQYKELQATVSQLEKGQQLAGILVDDAQAKVTGDWTASTSVQSFVGKGYIHDASSGKGEKSVTFSPELKPGKYRVLIAYTPGTNRDRKVPVTVSHAGGEDTTHVNQQQQPSILGSYVEIGSYENSADKPIRVTISNQNTSSVVIADGVRFIPVDVGDSDDAERLARLKTARAEVATKKASLDAAKKQLAELAKQAPKLPKVMSVIERPDAANFHVCIRGNVRNLGDEVPRGFLSVVTPDAPQIGKGESGRLQLAAWIARDDNPLTPRVAVNRIWQHTFGVGLVPTPDNFGRMGSEPANKELLDFLTATFIQSGWSQKQLVRSLVLSETFQRSSTASAELLAADPENKLLGRMNRRRLDGEAIRDNLLSFAGKLDLQPHTTDVAKVKSEFAFNHASVKRSIYVPVLRNGLHPLFDVFDVANPNLPVGRRPTSTLSTQALYLMNNDRVLDHVSAAAQKVLSADLDTDAERLDFAYLQALGRKPMAAESRFALAYLEKVAGDSQEKQLAAWTGICHAIVCSIDFRYLR